MSYVVVVNVYLLKSGHTSRGSWGLQVAKVFCILIAIKCILFQFYVKELIFFCVDALYG